MTGNSGFTGFGAGAFEFFAELRANNDPAWFKPRKSVYEAEVLAPFRGLIETLSEALREIGIPLAGDPKRAIFRIYRDVRFSPDKRLYKTHAGAVLTRSGGKRDPGLLYLHLAPGESMAAAGFWHPAPDQLARLRRAILADPDGFLRLAADLERARHPIGSDERLSRPPHGFEMAKGTAVADYVCWKSFTVHMPLRDAETQSADVVDLIVDFARRVMPFLDWGWSALDDDTPPIVIRAPARPLPKPDF
jgi:uncharacterized protein (TIGR02453 family)